MAEVDTSIYSPLMKPTNPMEQTNNLLDTIGKSQQVRAQQIGIDNAKFELAMKNIGAVNSTLSSLLGDPDVGKTDISKKIIDATTRLVKDNVYTAQHVTEALKSMPTDPAQQANWLRNIYSQTQSAEQRAQSFFGQPQTTSDGSNLLTTQTPQYPGKPTATRANIPMQLPPGTPTVAVTNPNDPNYGAPGYVGPSGPAGVRQGGPIPSSAKVVGDKEAESRGLYEPSASPKPVISGLPPGTAESMKGSAEAYNAAMEAAGKYAQRVNPLRSAIPILEKMKETDIGPSSERWNDIKSTAITLGAGKVIGGIDPEKIKDYNELKKYLSQYSSQAAATMGPKTNDGLATAVSSNPNVHMDKLSALELTKVALGVERMQQAAVREFNAKLERGEVAPAQLGRFMVKWASEQDPRAFVYDLLTPEQQAKLKKTLSKPELDKIRNGMNIADRHGLLGDVHQ